MPNRTVRTNDIVPDTYGFVRGTVTWSHIASHIEGEELERERERAQSQGRIATETGPYTRINIDNATITDNLGNPKPENTYTPMDMYLRESMYVHNNGQGGWAFTGRDKRRNALPEVFELLGDGTMRQIVLDPDQELAQGSDVIVAMQCYKPRTPGFNNGVSMRAVIIVGNANLRGSGGFNSFANYLAEQGIVVKGAETAPATTQVEVANPVVEQTLPWQNPQPQTPPMPTPAPQPLPWQNRQPEVPQQATPAPQPVTPPMPWQNQPAPAPAPAQPVQQNPFSYTPPQQAGADPAMQAPSYPPTQPGQGLNPPIDESAF